MKWVSQNSKPNHMKKSVSCQVTLSKPQGSSFCPIVLGSWTNVPPAPCRSGHCRLGMQYCWNLSVENRAKSGLLSRLLTFSSSFLLLPIALVLDLKPLRKTSCLLLLWALKQGLSITSFPLRLLPSLHVYQLLLFGEKIRRKKITDDNMANFKCRHAQKLLENQVVVCILILHLSL